MKRGISIKRAFAALLAAVMLASLFAACNVNVNTTDAATTAAATTAAATTAAAAPTESDAEPVVSVQFWGHVNEAWNLSHKATIEKFNKGQSAVEVVGTFFPYDDFEAKIQTSLMSGGAGADVYEIWGGWGLDFVASNALSQVPDDLINELKEDCYEPVMGAFEGADGKFYGVPVEFNNEYGGMLVNKVKFDELGLDYPETWDDIIDVARQTSDSSGEVFNMRGLDFTTNDTLTTTFLSMILSQGGQYWVDGKFKLTTTEANTALKTLVDYVVVDGLTNTDSAVALGDIESAHFLGRDEAMMVPRGPWVISLLEEEYDKEYGVDFDYVKFPFFSSTRAFPAETGWSMCVPKSTQVADAAWTYVDFFLDKENLLQHNINCAQIPPRKSVATDPAFVEQLTYMKPLVDILDYGKFIGPFNTDVLKFDLRDVFISLCSNDGTYASVSAALEALETQLNTELKLN